MNKLDALTMINIMKAKLLTLEKMIKEEDETEAATNSTPSWTPQSGYSYPHAELKGDGTDNPVKEVQYNNIEYSNYERFLRGWIEFYNAIGSNLTESDIERRNAYQEELDRVIFEG